MDHPVILLMGLPRSGTTWIAKMFDSHPRTVYLHEADRGFTLRAMPIAPDVADAEALRPIAEAFADSLLKMTDAHVVGSRPHFPKAYRSSVAAKLYELNSMASKLASAVHLDCPILPLVTYDKIPDLHVVWKSVISIARLGVFVRVLNERRAILLLRHPCGHVASMLRGEMEHNFAYPPSEDYKLFEILLATRQAHDHGLTMERLTSLHPSERLAWRWVIAYEKALQDIRGIGGCMSIRYEDVCAEPERYAKQMFDFCGLSWGPTTADFIKSSTSTETDKYYGLFKNPLKSAMRWQSDLSEEDIQRIYRVVENSDLERIYPRDDVFGAQSSHPSEVAQTGLASNTL